MPCLPMHRLRGQAVPKMQDVVGQGSHSRRLLWLHSNMRLILASLLLGALVGCHCATKPAPPPKTIDCGMGTGSPCETR